MSAFDLSNFSKAFNALKTWKEKSGSGAKRSLFETSESIFLVVTLRNIPSQTQAVRPKVITFPNPVHSGKVLTCIFCKDKDKAAMIEKSIGDHVLSISECREKLIPFEARRALAKGYTVFLADRAVYASLPSLLGKPFFKRAAKLPIPVTEITREVVAAASRTIPYRLPSGPTMLLPVAHMKLTAEQAEQNVAAALKELLKVLPGGAVNVQALSLKTPKSPSLPFLEQAHDGKQVLEPTKMANIDSSFLETLEEFRAEALSQGLVTVPKKRKRGSDVVEGTTEPITKKTKEDTKQ